MKLLPHLRQALIFSSSVWRTVILFILGNDQQTACQTSR